jgi:hypothetical protein
MHYKSPFWTTNFKTNSVINSKISFFPRGDSDSFQIDAVVNAANEYLAPSGRLCGRINDVATPELWELCQIFGGCPIELAVITPDLIFLQNMFSCSWTSWKKSKGITISI